MSYHIVVFVLFPLINVEAQQFTYTPICSSSRSERTSTMAATKSYSRSVEPLNDGAALDLLCAPSSPHAAVTWSQLPTDGRFRAGDVYIVDETLSTPPPPPGGSAGALSDNPLNHDGYEWTATATTTTVVLTSGDTASGSRCTITRHTYDSVTPSVDEQVDTESLRDDVAPVSVRNYATS